MTLTLMSESDATKTKWTYQEVSSCVWMCTLNVCRKFAISHFKNCQEIYQN